MSKLSEKQTYTTDYIDSLPEGERAELIDGYIYYMSSPSRKHQQVLFSLGRKIADYIDSNNGECEVDIAPFAVFLNNDNRTYVEPDISVICDKNKLDDKGCHGAPDWIIEIVSPASRRMDYFIKLFKYQKAGVKEYWIVDIDKERVTVYNFIDETINEYGFEEEIPCGLYEELSLKVLE